MLRRLWKAQKKWVFIWDFGDFFYKTMFESPSLNKIGLGEPKKKKSA